jgi:hypothetical protein
VYRGAGGGGVVGIGVELYWVSLIAVVGSCLCLGLGRGVCLW